MKGEIILENKELDYTAWDEGIFFLLSSIIILIPFAFYRYMMPNFIAIKDLIVQVLVLLAMAMWALKTISQSRINWQKSFLDLPILLFLLIGCLSFIWSVNIFHSILTIPIFTVGPTLFYITSNSLRTQKIIDRLLLIIIIVGAVLGVYGILQYRGIDFKFLIDTDAAGRGTIMGLFGNVNYLAEYLILPIALTIGLILSRKIVLNLAFLFSALILMGTTLLLTFTRSSYLGIAFSIPTMIFFYYRSSNTSLERRFYEKAIIFFLLFVIIALSVVYIPHPLNKRGTLLGKLRQRVTIESLTSGSSTVRRVAIWKFTWMMAEDYPLLGSGLGTYDYHTLKYQAEFFSKGNNRDIYPHGWAAQAHNEYLQLWSELGIVGLLSFLWIMVSYYYGLFKNLTQIEGKEKAIVIGLAGGVTAVLIDAIFGFPWQLVGSMSLFWMFIGLTVCQISISVGDKKNSKSTIKSDKGSRKEILKKIQKENGNVGISVYKGLAYLGVISLMLVSLFFIIRPYMAGIYYYQGNQEITKTNKNKEAIALYQKGLQWNPWNGDLYYRIGLNLSAHKRTAEALEYLHKAEKYTDNQFLAGNIAYLYLEREEYGKAIPYFRRAISYLPDKKSMVPHQVELGNIYLKIEEYGEAEGIFNNAIIGNPKSIEAYFGLAKAYINQDKREEAREALERVIKMASEAELVKSVEELLNELGIEDMGIEK